jgi:hypothetical protein
LLVFGCITVNEDFLKIIFHSINAMVKIEANKNQSPQQQLENQPETSNQQPVTKDQQWVTSTSNQFRNIAS